MRVSFCIFLVALLAACGGGGGTGPAVDVTTDDGGTDDGGTDGGTPPPSGLTDDQQFDPSNLTVNLPIGDDDHAQTFTVGITGRLDSVELMLSNPGGFAGTIRVDVRPTTAGVPNESDALVLGSANFDVTTLSILPELVKLDLTPFNIPVTAGDELAIVVRRLSGDPFVAVVHGATIEQYGSGAAYVREPGTTFTATFDGDFAFLTRVFAGP